MSKSITTELLQDIGSEVTTLATLVKIKRQDSKTFLFTDHVEDIEFGGDTYTSDVRCTLSATGSNSDLTVDNMDLTLYLDGVIFIKKELSVGMFKHAEIEVSIIDFTAPEHGTLTLRKGWLGETIINEQNVASITISGLMKLLDIEIGRVYQPSCDTDLGSKRCGVAINYDQQYSHWNTYHVGNFVYRLDNITPLTLTNASFETEDPVNTTPTGWTSRPGSVAYSDDTDPLLGGSDPDGPSDGSRYLNFGIATGGIPSPIGEDWIYQDISVGDTPAFETLVQTDKAYVSFQVDAINTLYLLDFYKASILFLDDNENTISEKTTGFTTNEAPDKWYTISLTEKVPANCSTLRILLEAKIEDGTHYNIAFDNIRVSYWDATNVDPTAGVMYKAVRIVDTNNPDHRKTLTNASFEYETSDIPNGNTAPHGWEVEGPGDYWKLLSSGVLTSVDGSQELYGGDDGSGTQSSYRLSQTVDLINDWDLASERIDLGFYYGDFDIFKGHNDSQTAGAYDITWYGSDGVTVLRLDANVEEIGAIGWSVIGGSFSVPIGSRFCKLTLKCTSPVGSSDAGNIAFDRPRFKVFDTELAVKSDPVFSRGSSSTVFDSSAGAITLDNNIVWKTTESFVRRDVVSAVSSRKEFTATAMAGLDGQYETGVVRWLTGNNVGQTSVIRTWNKDSKVIKTYFNVLNDIQIGDAFLYVRPCHKRFTEDCVLTFDNAINFQGFPHLPGKISE